MRPAAVAALCAGSAVAAWIGRSEVARRRATSRRCRARRWPLEAVRAICTAMEPGSRAESVVIAERARDGSLTTWSMRPGDAAPVGAVGTEVDLGGGQTALVFHELAVPDTAAGLEDRC